MVARPARATNCRPAINSALVAPEGAGALSLTSSVMDALDVQDKPEYAALDVQDKLEYARCAVAVLRALKFSDAKMTYKDLARSIGLIRSSGTWQPWHRQQIAVILSIAAAAEKLNAPDNAEPLEYDRIITGTTGESGEGVFKNSRIIRE